VASGRCVRFKRPSQVEGVAAKHAAGHCGDRDDPIGEFDCLWNNQVGRAVFQMHYAEERI
jgi:hypothetical protein